MLGTSDPRNAGVKVCLERAAVQVAPRALLVVVVKPAVLATLGTRPRLHLVMLGPDVHALLVHVELDAVDGPRFLEAQEMPVQVGVTHAPMIRAAIGVVMLRARRLQGCSLRSRRRASQQNLWAACGHRGGLWTCGSAPASPWTTCGRQTAAVHEVAHRLAGWARPHRVHSPDRWSGFWS